MVGITKGCPSIANPTWQTSASSRMASITSRSYAPRSGCRFTVVRADGTPEAYQYVRTMARSVIVSAVRTPFGKLGGALADKEATELGAIAIRAALDHAGVENEEVEYVIMGQVLQGGAGQAPARQASVGAGLPIEVGSDTINKVCASSIRAVEMADQMIRAGDHQVIVAGGMESMSNAPYALKKARFGYKLGDGTLIDLMTHDGLTSTFDKRHMVEQATIVSQAYVADEFAYLARTPAKAGKEALAKAGKKIGDVERVELNEAFSSVVLNSARMLDADPEKVNVNGGAVALGHPIGASGARILGTMIYELRRNGGGLGLAAICSGGGQGDAVLIDV